MNKTGKGGLAERKQHINRKGRPKDFASLRVLAQQIAHEEVTQSSGDARTVTELILRKWAGSNDPRLQMAFVEYAFGKVPAPVELSGKNGEKLEIVVRRENGIHRPNPPARRSGESDPDGEAVQRVVDGETLGQNSPGR